jgi:DNA-binding transcriptional MerR regulator
MTRPASPTQPLSEAAPHPDDDESRLYSIGELAAEFAITTRAIRFYEARGLLSPQRSGPNRCYTRRDRARLQLILRGKNLGFTLEDIAEYLSLYDRDRGQAAQTQLLLDKVEAHITALTSKRADIERTLKDLKAIKAQCQEHLKAATETGKSPGRTG